MEIDCSSPSPSKRDPTENSTMQVTQRRDFHTNSPCAERSRPTGDRTRSNTSIHSFLSHTTLFDEDWELLRFKLAAFQVTKTPNCSLLQSKAICQILAMIHPSFQDSSKFVWSRARKKKQNHSAWLPVCHLGGIYQLTMISSIAGLRGATQSFSLGRNHSSSHSRTRTKRLRRDEQTHHSQNPNPNLWNQQQPRTWRDHGVTHQTLVD